MGAWKGDAVELVDAFRSGKLSPIEELENVFVELENSELNTFSFVDYEGARKRARQADIDLPLGVVPI